MNIFKSFTFKWWQSNLFKVGMIFGGIAIGAYWHDFFSAHLIPIIIISLVCSCYVSYIWWKQIHLP